MTAQDAPAVRPADQASQNLEAVLDFYSREEQKVAKLIHLVEELRRDLPDVRDRHDADAVAMQSSMDPDSVVAALGEARRPQ